MKEMKLKKYSCNVVHNLWISSREHELSIEAIMRYQ